MTLKTRKVRINLDQPDGGPGALASITAELSVTEVDGLLVVPTLVHGRTDASGTALLHLWPNSRGNAGSQYKIVAVRNSVQLLFVTVTVPDGDANVEVLLESIITANAPATVNDAQLAVLQAQALVDQAATSAQAAAQSAAEAAGIGGYVVTTTNLSQGDLLMFDGSVFRNENKTAISDGGNF
jgi:hypothetical protein